jgi:SAM-dependent methyltransferase
MEQKRRLKRVAEYYDKNTKRFLRYGGRTLAVHRKLWAPDVANKNEALLYINKILVGIISTVFPKKKEPFRILDLGSGVGGTVFYLAAHLDAHVTGISNSSVQVEFARQQAHMLELKGRCIFYEGDFLKPPSLKPFDVIVAVESFSHAEDAFSFIRMASGNLLHGGILILCDDFLAPGSVNSRWVECFKSGWHLGSLTSKEEVLEKAQKLSLSLFEDRDLTKYIRINRTGLLGLKYLARIPFSSPFLDNIKGGLACQYCILSGLTQYRCISLRKG